MLGAERYTLSELAKMTAASQAERTVLEEEFNWLLKEEVHAVLKQLQDILKEASRRFSMPSPGLEGQLKQENFILGSSTMDQVKGVLTLQGEALTQADINIKVAKSSQVMHFAFRDDKQWKLQQIQDARNHVNQALQLLSSHDQSYHFKTGAEVNKLMDAVMLQLTRARNRLTTPASMTLPELAASGLMKMFTPPMPGDVTVNFYINLSKLCLTVYQLHVLQPNTTKVSSHFQAIRIFFIFFTVILIKNVCFKMHNHFESRSKWNAVINTFHYLTEDTFSCSFLSFYLQISVFSSFWNYRPF
uniref:Protein rogdi homolog n=1 Tax=Sinocyclocheilus grahami TaxID=75366 RepID=A0A672SQV4_SINGR